MYYSLANHRTLKIVCDDMENASRAIFNVRYTRVLTHPLLRLILIKIETLKNKKLNSKMTKLMIQYRE